MGRIPCCERETVKRGQWTLEEDTKLSTYIAQHGTRNWRLIPRNAGLQRCGKSCRLRWTNYLRPDLKRGEFSDSEEQTIMKLHAVLGNRWSMIAGQLQGRTDNDVKNHWNTKLKKKLTGMGIDPVTHKPFSHLITEIATTLAPPQVAHLAEAALGCFKDEMLHLLTKRRVDFTAPPPPPAAAAFAAGSECINSGVVGVEDEETSTVQMIKMGLSKAVMQQQPNRGTMDGSAGEPSGGAFAGLGEVFPANLPNSDDVAGFRYDGPSYGNDGEGSAWSQSTCTGGGGAAVRFGGAALLHKGEEEEEDDEETEGRKAGEQGDATAAAAAAMFSFDCVLWDLSDDLMINPMM